MTNAPRADRNVLYISYDGLTDPLGRSQVLPYLQGLARRGHRITILSCEKLGRQAAGEDTVRRICHEAKISWHIIPYRNRPPVLAHAYTVASLTRKAAHLHKRQRFDLVHCRSYVPAMAGLHLKKRFGIKLLFDMRGFWPDEKLEGGSWPQRNPVYRMVYWSLKRIEVCLLKGADHIISLTDEGKRVMAGWSAIGSANERVTVIPCCVDFDHFPLVDAGSKSAARDVLGIPAGTQVLAYLGSLGAWYMRDEMLDFFRVYLVKHPQARFLFVTRDHEAEIKAAAARRGLPVEQIVVRAASREQVPQFMSAADIGIFFIKPVSSKSASSPTKMGEMLALGLPTVANSGVGDVAAILHGTGVGVSVEDFTEAAYARAIDEVEAIALSPQEIRSRALPWFDGELGIERYDHIYRTI